ncbi:hypothetical protein JCM24511_09618 [Saitozyma sp. JCM 24511]|nr:hypothetical protein JCM24511_09618 [Saitozyma sp. JCM 24511]
MSFHTRQLTLRALLFSELLILGHVLLTTTASAPLPVLTSPTLPLSIKSISSLIFLTLLWLCFTVLELADSDASDASGAPTKHGHANLCFSQLRVEMGLNGVLGLAWAAYFPDATAILVAYSTDLAPQLVILTIAYYTALVSLLSLFLHTLCALSVHAGKNGWETLVDGAVWKGKAGGWRGGRIRLEGGEGEGETHMRGIEEKGAGVV